MFFDLFRQAVTKWETGAGVPEGVAFTALAKGIGTSISYEKDGNRTEAFDVPEAENIIELNGIKSELVIST